MATQTATSHCLNCRERFPRKKGKRFCSMQCRVNFHKAGGTPTRAIEARIKKLIRSGSFDAVIREQVVDEVARQISLRAETSVRHKTDETPETTVH